MPSTRTTDPETSRLAEESVTELRPRQDAIHLLLRTRGPMHDELILSSYAEAFPRFPQSDSGLRTRRKELVDQGLIRDTGVRARTSTGRSSIVWEAVPRNQVQPSAEVRVRETRKQRIAREHHVFVVAYSRIITKMNTLRNGFSSENPMSDEDMNFSAGVRYALDEIQSELDRPMDEES